MQCVPSTSDGEVGLSSAPVWNYFKKLPPGNKVQCSLCPSVIKTEYGSTTGMHRHLFQHPKAKSELTILQEKYSALKKSTSKISKSKKLDAQVNQPKLADFAKWSNDHPKQKALTTEIGKWLATGFHPYSLVEENGLKNVLKLAQPLYSLPSSKTFSRRVIPELYENTVKNLSTEISTAVSSCASLAFTADMWSSRSNHAFLSLTMHYMHQDFSLKTHCLGSYHFEGEHTGYAISEKLADCIKKWNLTDACNTIPVFLVTDNAKNMKCAGSLLVFKEVSHLSCFAHTLQLVLSDAKKSSTEMQMLVKICRSVVGYYKHSTTATERLHKIQKQLGMAELQVIQDCETRWNSEYLMMERLLTIKEALSIDLASEGKHDNLSISQWKLVDAYVKILKPLYQATVEVCGERTPTSSIVIPVIYLITSKLEKHCSITEHGIGKTFGNNLLLALKARFPAYKQKQPYLSAMILDPRFKHILLEKHERNAAVHFLAQVCHTLSSTEAPNESPSETPDSIWEEFSLLASQTQNTSETSANLFNQHLDVYLNEPVVHISQDSCLWWRNNVTRFATLKTVVLKYLGIPATEVASERVFSSAGNVVTSKRERLTSEHVEELVFLHENLK